MSQRLLEGDSEKVRVLLTLQKILSYSQLLHLHKVLISLDMENWKTALISGMTHFQSFFE